MLVLSPDHIFACARRLIEKQGLDTSLVKLRPKRKVYRHVVALIRLLKEVNYIDMSSQIAMQLAEFWAPRPKLLVTDNIINTYDY